MRFNWWCKIYLLNDSSNRNIWNTIVFTMIWPRILSTGMFPPHFKPCSLPLLYVVCLVLIFLERAFTLICPFRHRVTITRSYIHSIIFAWFTGITLGTFSLLAVNGIVDFTHWIVAWPIAVFQPDVCWLLYVISLIVRRKVNTCRLDPAMVKNHSKNRPNDEKHI